MSKTTKAKLKAFFASKFFKYGDVEGPAWSTLTGGDIEGLSLEAINRAIDDFDEDNIG